MTDSTGVLLAILGFTFFVIGLFMAREAIRTNTATEELLKRANREFLTAIENYHRTRKPPSSNKD